MKPCYILRGGSPYPTTHSNDLFTITHPNDPSTSSSSSPLIPFTSYNINELEDRKPILGVNGSPHPPHMPPISYFAPPLSPSPSIRSRGDSPLNNSDYDGIYRNGFSSSNASSEHSPSSNTFSLPSNPGSSISDTGNSSTATAIPQTSSVTHLQHFTIID